MMTRHGTVLSVVALCLLVGAAVFSQLISTMMVEDEMKRDSLASQHHTIHYTTLMR